MQWVWVVLLATILCDGEQVDMYEEYYEEEVLEEFTRLDGSTLKVTRVGVDGVAMSFGEGDWQSHLKSKSEVTRVTTLSPHEHIALISMANTRAVMDCSPSHKEECQLKPPQVLMIGLGGGSEARYLHQVFPNVNLTIVEIEPATLQAANKYFGFKQDSRLHVVVQDCIDYLAQVPDGSFDLIIHEGADAKGMVPVLNTDEFVQLLHSKVHDNGLIHVNVVSLSNGDEAEDENLTMYTWDLYLKHSASIAVFRVDTFQHVFMVHPKKVIDNHRENARQLAAVTQQFDPSKDHFSFLNGSFMDVTHPAVFEHFRSGSQPKQIQIHVTNGLDEPIDVYYDSNPHLYCDCKTSCYPTHSDSLKLQGTIPPREDRVSEPFTD